MDELGLEGIGGLFLAIEEDFGGLFLAIGEDFGGLFLAIVEAEVQAIKY